MTAPAEPAVREPESPLHRAGHIGDEVGAEHPAWVTNRYAPFDVPGFDPATRQWQFEPWNLAATRCQPFLWTFDEAGEPLEPVAPASAENASMWLDRLPGECGVSPEGTESWVYEGRVIAWQRQRDEAVRTHGPMADPQEGIAVAVAVEAHAVANQPTAWLPRADTEDTQSMTRFLEAHDALNERGR